MSGTKKGLWWFHTDGQLNSTTLVSHSPPQRERRGRKHDGKRLMGLCKNKLKEKEKEKQAKAAWMRKNNYSLLSTSKQYSAMCWEDGPQ